MSSVQNVDEWEDGKTLDNVQYHWKKQAVGQYN